MRFLRPPACDSLNALIATGAEQLVAARFLSSQLYARTQRSATAWGVAAGSDATFMAACA